MILVFQLILDQLERNQPKIREKIQKKNINQESLSQFYETMFKAYPKLIIVSRKLKQKQHTNTF